MPELPSLSNGGDGVSSSISSSESSGEGGSEEFLETAGYAVVFFLAVGARLILLLSVGLWPVFFEIIFAPFSAFL